jgi:hypothetical protein
VPVRALNVGSEVYEKVYHLQGTTFAG